MCGIIGIYSNNKNQYVCSSIYTCLIALQHRGQESAGIWTYFNDKLEGIKEMGLVSQVFNKKNLAGLFGNAGIGHVRYSTTGTSTVENAMPYFFDSPFIKFSLSFNGTLTNFKKLKEEYAKDGHIFNSSTDTEVLAQVLAKEILKDDNYIEGIKRTMEVLQGACSVILLNEAGEIYGFKDLIGFKPLCIGETKELSVIASESVGIDALKGRLIKNLEPGEIVKIEKDGSFSYDKGIESKRKAFCMFEYVYFSRLETRFKNNSDESVYDVRFKLGVNLAKTHPVEADVVVPIPDSGKTAAEGYAFELNLPCREGLIKNRYIHRTFIMPSQDLRDYSVSLKLTPIRSQIKDKEVVLVDDSIVRGTTCRQIVKLVKDAGAKKVHLRISCPPIISGCYMGIDFPSKKELFAPKRTLEEMENYLGVDSLRYQTIDGLIDSIGLKKEELCMACLNNDYPSNLEDVLE